MFTWIFAFFFGWASGSVPQCGKHHHRNKNLSRHRSSSCELHIVTTRLLIG